MRVCLLVSVMCAVLVCPTLSIANADQQQDGAGNQKHSQTHQGATPSPSATVSSSVSAPAHEANAKSDKQERPYWRKVLMPEVLPGWLLAAIGAAAAIFAYRTLRTIERQTKANEASAHASKRSADAAKVSADYLRQSLRAWVMVELDWVPGYQKIWSVNHGSMVSIRMLCHNRGQSPAWITEKRIGFTIVDREPNRPTSLPPHFSANTLTIVQEGREPVDGGRVRVLDIPALESENALGLGEMAVVYGVIKYVDIFGAEHETRFGYTPYGDAFQYLEGYPEYNQST